MKTQNNQSSLIRINDIVKFYLPISKRLARKFVSTYLDYKLIGNRIFVERDRLEALLSDPDRERLPLNL